MTAVLEGTDLQAQQRQAYARVAHSIEKQLAIRSNDDSLDKVHLRYTFGKGVATKELFADLIPSTKTRTASPDLNITLYELEKETRVCVVLIFPR